MDQAAPRPSKPLKNAGKHGVGIKKRTDERKIPYVSSGSFAVKKQCSKEWSKEKESASTQKSQKHAEKKSLVCDMADLFLISKGIHSCDRGHQHYSCGSCKGGRKQEQGKGHSRKDPVNFQCL